MGWCGEGGVGRGWCGEGGVVIKIISSFIVISNYYLSCRACCTSGRRGVGSGVGSG